MNNLLRNYNGVHDLESSAAALWAGGAPAAAVANGDCHLLAVVFEGHPERGHRLAREPA